MAGLCLAAGASSRMGCPKQLLPWGGATLLQASVRTLLQSPLSSCTVVLGANASAVAASLEVFAADARFSAVINERWADGMATSLVAGLRSLLAREVSGSAYLGVLIALGDMPLVESGLIAALIDELSKRGSAAIVAPVYEGKRGHPVLIGRAYWEELLQLSGDRGASAVLKRHSDQLHLISATASVLSDIDTREQWQQHRPLA